MRLSSPSSFFFVLSLRKSSPSIILLPYFILWYKRRYKLMERPPPHIRQKLNFTTDTIKGEKNRFALSLSLTRSFF